MRALVLLVATVFVGVLSESLVGSIEAARARLGFTQVFVGIIVVAIIGLLAAMAIPNIAKNREIAQLRAIENN